MSRTARTHVRNVAGEQVAILNVEVPINSTVLKERIKKELGHPVLCQKLLLDDGSILEDGAGHESFPKGDLNVTLVLSLHAVYLQVAAQEAPDRVEALEALGAVAHSIGTDTYDQSVNYLMAGLHDRYANVRRAAAQSLCKVVSKGTQWIVDQLAAHLGDKDQEVRDAVLAALAMLAVREDMQTVDALLLNWQKLNSSAVDVLIELCPEGHDATVARLQGLCQARCDEQHCQMSAAALGGVAIPGDSTSIDVLICLSQNVVGGVREVALRSLARLAPRDHKGTISVMLLQLRDWHPGARREAVKGLGDLATLGDEQVINALCDTVESEQKEIQSLAICGLVRIAPPGHVQVRSVLKEVLDLTVQSAIDWLAQPARHS
eukprot:TRINITY_DN34434_c0_g1_i1.p1 TRINITY_DN34434_c0_g1~~TRINITY_DN34434_c0_g1_i1.p1  ORF type:complete len:377 (-),score=55.10 TRINITY_DN34434_c0_g1_i1:61-1191(-)